MIELDDNLEDAISIINPVGLASGEHQGEQCPAMYKHRWTQQNLGLETVRDSVVAMKCCPNEQILMSYVYMLIAMPTVRALHSPEVQLEYLRVCALHHWTARQLAQHFTHGLPIDVLRSIEERLIWHHVGAESPVIPPGSRYWEIL